MARTALIVTDMLNTHEHAAAARLVRSVEESVPAMEGLIRRADDEDVLTVYVNDNYGAWRSSRQELVDAALNGRHGHLAGPIAPPDEALFVVKARHSIFYQTP